MVAPVTGGLMSTSMNTASAGMAAMSMPAAAALGPVGWAAIGLNVASSLFSVSQSKKAEKAAKEAGERRAAFTMQETQETLRRKALADAQEAGIGEASVAAAGLRMSGSPTAYLDFLAQERRKESAWILKAGQLKAAAEREGGGIAASQQSAQGVLYALQGAQSVVNVFDRGASGVRNI